MTNHIKATYWQAEAVWGELYHYDHEPAEKELLLDFKGCGGSIEGIDVWGPNGLVRNGHYERFGKGLSR